MVRMLAVTALAMLAFAQATLAQNGDRPCRADVEQFCAAVEPGGGRVASCLSQHELELSPECVTQIQEMRKRRLAAHEACDDDVDRFCQGIDPGERRIVTCLKEHMRDLSKECRGVMRRQR
jgi:hypothetical protein